MLNVTEESVVYDAALLIRRYPGNRDVVHNIAEALLCLTLERYDGRAAKRHIQIAARHVARLALES